MKSAVISLAAALAKGPPPAGNLAIPVFTHGTLETELYAPRGADPQTPHDRDEVYVVAQGTASFVGSKERCALAPGAFIFVAAGETHRFEDLSADFAVWVFFYGPEGGESD